MTNKELARYLKQTAALIELTGGNPFRIRAFQNGARTIERLETPARTLAALGKLTSVPGIGKGLAADVTNLLTHGSFPLRDDLLTAIPPGLLEIMRIKGLGAKKTRALWQNLGITSLDGLEHAGQTNQIANLKGFGAKTQNHILDQIVLLRQYITQRRGRDAVRLGHAIYEALAALPDTVHLDWAGEVRRQLDTVSALEFVVAGPGPKAVSAALSAIEIDLIPDPAGDGHTLRGTLTDGFPVIVHLTIPDHFGSALWAKTGAPAHCTAFVRQFGAPAPCADETLLYQQAGLDWIPPALREDDGEWGPAQTQTLPELVTVTHLQGSLHNHSTYSDGAHSLKEMADRARDMGLSYFGICDHSQSLTIAHGLSVAQVRAQQQEIAELNAQYAADGGPAFRIFSGIESDILTDGSLDYPDEVLADFDFVVASVHTGFNMTEAAATDRILTAIANPFTTILGHPTGRLLLVREGYPIDHAKVIAACAEHGVVIELNANPYRLDLDWRWIREATRQDILISINPDAHSMDELALVRWGVDVAQKGWLTPDQCLNAKSLADFTAWLDEPRANR